jgi:cytochrome c2
MKKSVIIIVVLVAVLMLVAACGGSKPAEPTAAPTKAPTEAPTMAPTEAPAAEATSEPAEAATPAGEEQAAGDPARGEAAFVDLGCSACHTDKDTELAPTLHGLYGKKVKLETGFTAVANDEYLRESILDPGVKLVKGYGPLMPSTFASLDEDTLNDLIAYIRSLGD